MLVEVCSVTMSAMNFTNAAFKSVDEIEVSSLEILQFDLEEFAVQVNKEYRAVVDEVSERPDGICVYVEGDVTHNAPPSKLLDKMVEHGYVYDSWVMNGRLGDERAIFNFKPIVPAEID